MAACKNGARVQLLSVDHTNTIVKDILRQASERWGECLLHVLSSSFWLLSAGLVDSTLLYITSLYHWSLRWVLLPYWTLNLYL